MKNILILGGKSNLASYFEKLYKDNCLLIDRTKCDITNEKELTEQIANFKGQFIINCAAITNVELCESQTDRCFEINTNAVKKINDICLKYNKKLIQISSDYAINPINVYGKSKAKAEQLVNPKFLIIRTNFYSQKNYIVQELLKNKKTKIYDNVFFNPVSAVRLVKEIINNLNQTGILNIFSNKKISYLNFANLIIEVFNLPKSLIINTKFNDSDNVVKRPFSSYTKSDINIDLKKDLIEFKNYLDKVKLNYDN